MKHGNVATLLSNTKLSELIMKCNTAISFSVAVERLFPLGKDVLKPKRSGLRGQHFEMLFLLKKSVFVFVMFLRQLPLLLELSTVMLIFFPLA